MKKHLLFPALLLLAGSAQADTVIQFSHGPEQNSAISIKNGIVYTPAGQGQRMLWDTNNNRMLMVNDAQKQFMVIDTATIEQASGFMEQMREQMMAQLKSMPEEQRKALERQMGINLSKPAVPKVELKSTGKGRTISSIRCAQSDIFTNGQKTGEVCIASIKDSGINPQDYATMKKMFNLSKKMAEKTASMGAPGAGMIKDMPDLNGVPMEFRDLSSGQAVLISSVNSSAQLDPANFAPGQGYQQVNPFQQMQQLQGMMPPKQ